MSVAAAMRRSEKTFRAVPPGVDLVTEPAAASAAIAIAAIAIAIKTGSGA